MPEQGRLDEHFAGVHTTIRVSASTRNGEFVPKRILTATTLALALGGVSAQDETDDGAAGFLQAPTVEPSPVTGEAVEPEITIVEEGDRLIYEYRVRGVLYMVRIQPQVGPPYYLYDLNGDGLIDAQDRSPRNTSVPQWVLFEWD